MESNREHSETVKLQYSKESPPPVSVQSDAARADPIHSPLKTPSITSEGLALPYHQGYGIDRNRLRPAPSQSDPLHDERPDPER